MVYEIVIEQTENGFSAYVPDLPGCVAAAVSREETQALLLEAMDFHLEAVHAGQNLAFGVIGTNWFGGRTSAAIALGQHEFTFAAAAPAEYVRTKA